MTGASTACSGDPHVARRGPPWSVPEGDTVWRTAHRLDQALAGRVLTVSDLRWPSLATVDLRGATHHRGRRPRQAPAAPAATPASPCTATCGWRASGGWRPPDQVTAGELRQRPHLRAVVGTAEWTCIGTAARHARPRADGRRGARSSATSAPTCSARTGTCRGRWPTCGATRSEPIGDGAAGPAAAGRDRHAVRLAESLFLERHPPLDAGRRARRRRARARCVERAHRLLDAAPAPAVQSTTGIQRPGEEAYVHARSGRPCRRCGDDGPGRDDRAARRRTARCSTARPARAAWRRPTTAGPSGRSARRGGPAGHGKRRT